MEVRKTPDGRGYGLYATKHFKKGERLGSYKGERIDQEELDRRYGGGRSTVAEYTVRVGENTYLDDYMKEGLLSYANDPVDLKLFHKYLKEGYGKMQAYSMATDREAKNAMMSAYAGHATLYASRHIYPGDEILWSYGYRYWVA